MLAYDGSHMTQVDAGGILDIAMAGTSATLLARNSQRPAPQRRRIGPSALEGVQALRCSHRALSLDARPAEAERVSIGLGVNTSGQRRSLWLRCEAHPGVDGPPKRLARITSPLACARHRRRRERRRPSQGDPGIVHRNVRRVNR